MMNSRRDRSRILLLFRYVYRSWAGEILMIRHYRYTTVWFRVKVKKRHVQIVDAGFKRLVKQRVWAM